MTDQFNIQIENQINQLLKGVKPDPHFVEKLKEKLVSSSEYYGKTDRSVRWIILSSGLLIGLLVLILYRNKRSNS